MKNTLSIALFFTVLFSCSQQQEKGFSISEITESNLVNKVLENVKHYDQEPMYMLRIAQDFCIYEILVNDYPVEKHYRTSTIATPITINHAILKSGKQTITYRLYPVGELLKEEYGEEAGVFNELTGGTFIKIEVIRVDNIKEYPENSKEKTLMVHTSAVDSKDYFVGRGKKYYEFTFSFEAQVPYENEGWSKGVDLTKLDQKILEQKVLEYYKNMQQVYIKKDMDVVAKLNFDYLARLVRSKYKDKDYIKEMTEELLEPVNYNDKEFYPLQDYQMQFYGNGRLVTLKYPTLYKDPFLNGDSSFIFDYTDEDGDISTYSFRLNLCMSEEIYKKTGEIQLERTK